MSAQDDNPASQVDRAPVVRIAVVQGAEPDDWRVIYDRLNDSSQKLASVLVKSSAAAGTFLGMFLVAGFVGLAVIHLIPDISAPVLAGVVILPGLMTGVATGQAAGNAFLRLWYRLDDATRRGFATRLGLGRAPLAWHPALRRWLFTGNWLGTPSYDLRLPYVRIFILGDAPATCREEDRIWREIHGQISGDSLWEAGTNVREISYPQQLPSWARDVGKGDGYADLRRRIGDDAASEWVMHLWRRAVRQWPALGVNDYPERARRECFELHSIPLADHREALVVVLRPVTFVQELEMEAAAKDSIAA